VANLQSISEAYTALGDMDKAEEYSIKYLENNPNAKPSEYSKLAGVYIEKTKEAMELAKAAKEAKKTAEAGQYDTDAATNWQKALSIYDKLVAKHPHTADYAAYQKGHQAFVLGMDDEAITFLQPLVSNIRAKSELTDDDKYYLSNSCFDLGYIYWSSKNDLDAAKPFFQDVYNYSTVETHKNIAKKALGLDEEQ
jgi:tetratricopeptide (TPR) repeat protein